MIILFIHAETFSFQVKERAIKSAEEDFLNSLSKENALVAFTTVEKEDDEQVVERAVESIMDVYSQVKASCVVIYPYAHLSNNLADPKTAVTLLRKMEEKLKGRVEVYRAPFGWYKSFSISCYGHPLSELSRRIGKERDLEKSEELSVCEKFGFPYSPKAVFMKNAVVEFLKYLVKPKGVIIGTREVPKGYMSVVYSKPSGRTLPCINEDPRIEVYYERFELEFPRQFSDSKNTLTIWDERRVDVGNLVYYLLLKAKAMDTPILPLWVSPIHVRILPVRADLVGKAMEFAERLYENGLRVEVDNNDDSLGNKIRRAGSDWVPFVGVLGDREVKTNTLTVRVRGNNEQRSMTLEELVEAVKKEDKLLLRQNSPVKMRDDSS
ncbi:MAG: threonyl-tRNA synthetase editing domain-containing protein [Candidatus Aramenus sulfurataquae]|uniref:Threonine--tRNA ligase editing subunit n=4 Tax=Candidatus Aramenus sulfurataquae TaxID=1326980 RepID=A0A0F2LPV5_9CREN